MSRTRLSIWMYSAIFLLKAFRSETITMEPHLSPFRKTS